MKAILHFLFGCSWNTTYHIRYKYPLERTCKVCGKHQKFSTGCGGTKWRDA